MPDNNGIKSGQAGKSRKFFRSVAGVEDVTIKNFTPAEDLKKAQKDAEAMRRNSAYQKFMNTLRSAVGASEGEGMTTANQNGGTQPPVNPGASQPITAPDASATGTVGTGAAATAPTPDTQPPPAGGGTPPAPPQTPKGGGGDNGGGGNGGDRNNGQPNGGQGDGRQEPRLDTARPLPPAASVDKEVFVLNHLIDGAKASARAGAVAVISLVLVILVAIAVFVLAIIKTNIWDTNALRIFVDGINKTVNETKTDVKLVEQKVDEVVLPKIDKLDEGVKAATSVANEAKVLAEKANTKAEEVTKKVEAISVAKPAIKTPVSPKGKTCRVFDKTTGKLLADFLDKNNNPAGIVVQSGKECQEAKKAFMKKENRVPVNP